MSKHSTSAWGDRPRAIFKSAFILYLATVTGCANTMQDAMNQSKAVEQPHGANYQASGVATVPNGAASQFNLPDMGLKPQQATQAADDKSDLNDMLAKTQGAQYESRMPNASMGTSRGGSDFQNMAFGMLSSASSQAVKNWFSAKHATAEMTLGAGRGGVKTGSFDLLVPIVDGEKDLFFTQVGIRRSNSFTEDYRTTVNLGVGYRKTFNTWLLGVNSFYDRDMTGKNDRLGIGAEAMTDFLKISANGYFRLSDWKKSPDLANYLERPSNGFDLRAEAYLPSYPQLGGKLVYEQYYGNDVGLFGSSERQKDPSAVTIGVIYNPVPMVGIGVDHRQGQGGLSDNTVKFSINYQFDVPLAKQLSSAYVANHRLENARYSLVSRNNEIVLDYKQAEHATLALPAQLNGTPAQVLSFPVTLAGGRISNATWTGTASTFVTPYNGSGTSTITLPAYSASGANTYTLQVVGTDVYGQAVQSNPMSITVQPFQIALMRSKAEATADGSDAVTFTAELKEPDGTPRAATAITWNVQGSATIESADRVTNNVGRANLKLVSRFASSIIITAKEPQGAVAESDASFMADPATAKVSSLSASPATIKANGTDSSVLKATLKDANGIPLGEGVTVTWSTSTGTLSASSTVTDSTGVATVTLTGTTAGTANVTATAVAGAATTAVSLISDTSTAKVVSVVATPSSIAANGTATSTLVASVTDANGNVVGAGVPVTWSTTSGTLSTASSITNAGGQASVTLKGTAAGTATVTAAGTAGSSTASVTLVPDTATAKVVTLTATPTSITANGIATSTLVASVTDAHGNVVGAGVAVNWSTTSGTLSATASTTNDSGQASVTLKGTAAGTATVTAAGTAGSLTATVTLLADTSTAKVVSLTATPSSITANGTSISTLVASVTDANSNVVGAGVTVNWSTTSGTLSAASSTTNASGKASVTLKGTTAGTATVTAAGAAGSSTANVTLVADSSTAKVMSLTATPSTIPANGTSISTLLATVRDANDNVVDAGVAVSWSTTSGTLSAASSTTNASGQASVTLKGTTAGTATVTAAGAAGSSTASVTLVADTSTAQVVSLIASPASITANGTSTSTLVASVTDAHGNVVGAGVAVNWGTTRGTLSAASSTTNASGKTSVTLKGTTAGTASVTAAGAAGSSTETVTLVADTTTAQVMSLSATPSSITANGTSTSTLVATVTDANGNALGAGYAVSWSTTSGTLSATSSTTNASGQASVTLKGTAAGTATVTAAGAAGAAGSSTATVTLVADSSTARVVGLSASPMSIEANGASTSTLGALLKDAYGNALGSGITVTWATNMGSVTSSSTTNSEGYAIATLTSGTTAGTETFTASAPGGALSGNVTFTAPASTAPVVTSLTADNTYFSRSTNITNSLAVDLNNDLYTMSSFKWVVASGTATSYDVLNANGAVLCSSTGNTCKIPDESIRTTNAGTQRSTVTVRLRANYNGTSSIIYTSTVNENQTTCSDCGTS